MDNKIDLKKIKKKKIKKHELQKIIYIQGVLLPDRQTLRR